jgi:hypothetical protein
MTRISSATLMPEAKQLLSATIRELRERLLRDIQDEAERRYRLSVSVGQAGLDEAHRRRRGRLEAWLGERVRASKAKNEKERQATKERLLGQAVKEAGATLLNRLVVVRQLEAKGLSRPVVVADGWNSQGYRDFRDFGAGLLADESEGYGTLLQVVFDELALELPGLFGEVGLTKLFPIPPATLREVVSRLDDKDLACAWTDDTTLGWVYQYWNDPEREALDAKINDGGKIEPHEIASKTQMFTERYMVDWLLQNSLGLTWLCICKKNGWEADAERVLPVLDKRRAAWRAKREAGEVALDALMTIESELEDCWKYFVPQPIPDDAVAKAPNSIRDLKLLDPACGSGHFLVSAFTLLVTMYREEARHRGVSWSDAEIADSILANNLHGVDIDPRAIQIAAAALFLKAKSLSPEARPSRLNLVAPTLQLGNLPDDDPSLIQLRSELKREAGLSEDLTRRLVSALAGVDYLGTLLKVDAAVDEALQSADLEIERGIPGQGDLWKGFAKQQVKLTFHEAKATVLDKLEQFLAKHSSSEDLGLRLDGEQLASGVRFVRMVKEGSYDVVVGNPPYQGLSKTAIGDYVAKKYPRGKADLYAAFLERGIELARDGGLSALLTMRGWMFLGQFADLRERLLKTCDLTALVDLDSGAFEAVSAAQVVLSVAAVIFRKSVPDDHAVAIRPTPTEDRASHGMTSRKRAGLLAQVGRYEFDPKGFEVIEGEPIVYWWTKDFLAKYASAPKLGELSPVRKGIDTGDNARFVRRPWEIIGASMLAVDLDKMRWAPYVQGGKGKSWEEPLENLVHWSGAGLQIRSFAEISSGCTLRNTSVFFVRGVAFTPIGAEFSARTHRFQSICDNMGSSVFPAQLAETVTSMNRSESKRVLASINPTVHFQVGDVNRLPIFPVANSDEIFATIESAFTTHESHRESSVEFKSPGPSPWRYAQDWAQRSVDRPEGAALPPYEPVFDQPEPVAFVSFAIGVALGRFGAQGEGLLDAAPAAALPGGILFVSPEGHDSVDHTACSLLLAAWKEHGAAVGGQGSETDDLRDYLTGSFFAYHKKLYENRPIYFPLSSAKKSYLALVSIHRWQDDTLNVLLADHLVPEKRRLEGELEDIRKERVQSAVKGKLDGKVEKRYGQAQKLLEEITDFIAKVTHLAECGPLNPDDKTPPREVDARFVMDLDDGVMVNSAALWPLLEPQWKDPKKWWKELATAQGRKDYDWAHLSARYFPTRVAAKCKDDPSLAVAHHCFWRLHPAKAYAWELRLQDEIKPAFTIDEPGSDEARAQFLAAHPEDAAQLRATEQKRRDRKATKSTEDDTPLLDQVDDDEGDDEAAHD